MRTYRTYAFILEINMRRCAKSLFKPIGAHQRCRTIIRIFIKHLIWYVNPPVSLIKFLSRTFLAEKGGQVINCDRLTCHGIKHRHRLDRHISLYIIPLFRYIFFRENKSFLFHLSDTVLRT